MANSARLGLTASLCQDLLPGGWISVNLKSEQLLLPAAGYIAKANNSYVSALRAFTFPCFPESQSVRLYSTTQASIPGRDSRPTRYVIAYVSIIFLFRKKSFGLFAWYGCTARTIAPQIQHREFCKSFSESVPEDNSLDHKLFTPGYTFLDQKLFYYMSPRYMLSRACILVQVTIYRRIRIGWNDPFEQSASFPARPTTHNVADGVGSNGSCGGNTNPKPIRYIVICMRIRAQGHTFLLHFTQTIYILKLLLFNPRYAFHINNKWHCR